MKIRKTCVPETSKRIVYTLGPYDEPMTKFHESQSIKLHVSEVMITRAMTRRLPILALRNSDDIVNANQ
jgi:hypothetical protein